MSSPALRLQTTTAQALAPPSIPPPHDALHELLQAIYNLATKKGNVAAAKLYLDYHLRIAADDNQQLDKDDILKILAEQI
jgi:hypothetical protein